MLELPHNSRVGRLGHLSVDWRMNLPWRPSSGNPPAWRSDMINLFLGPCELNELPFTLLLWYTVELNELIIMYRSRRSFMNESYSILYSYSPKSLATDPIFSFRLHLWNPESKNCPGASDSAPSETNVPDLRPAGSNRFRTVFYPTIRVNGIRIKEGCYITKMSGFAAPWWFAIQGEGGKSAQSHNISTHVCKTPRNSAMTSSGYPFPSHPISVIGFEDPRQSPCVLNRERWCQAARLQGTRRRYSEGIIRYATTYSGETYSGESIL